MKRLLPIFAISLLLIACSNQPSPPSEHTTTGESTTPNPDLLHTTSTTTETTPPIENEPLRETPNWNESNTKGENSDWAEKDWAEETWEDPHPEVWDHNIQTFNREAICSHLSQKVENRETLFVHLFVPLCDNENQGIVPVPARIGNGQDPRNNLYWGAGYGIRNFFDKKVKAWQFLEESKVPNNTKILERLLFYRKFENGAQVCVVADAYDGAEMETCIRDFLQSIAGKRADYWTVQDSIEIPMHGHTDLLIFNGHNGLMDGSVELIPNEDNRQKDAMVIACASYGYFEPYLDAAGGYPLLTTTNLLAPEAYVVESAISEWARLKTGADVHHAAGVAYNKYHNCGLRAAKNTFQTGWN